MPNVFLSFDSQIILNCLTILNLELLGKLFT